MQPTLDVLAQRLSQWEEWDTGPFILFVIAYFVPLLIALGRRHRFSHAIGAINILLGWTGIGWLASLIWAVNRDVPEAAVEEPAPSYEMREPSLHYFVDSEAADAERIKACAWCAEEIKAAAIVCHFCGRDVAITAAPSMRQDLQTAARAVRAPREAGARPVARKTPKPKVRWLRST